jgi:hypothetical protein
MLQVFERAGDALSYLLGSFKHFLFFSFFLLTALRFRYRKEMSGGNEKPPDSLLTFYLLHRRFHHERLEK